MADKKPHPLAVIWNGVRGAKQDTETIIAMLIEEDKEGGPSPTEQIIQLLEQVVEGQRQTFLRLDAIDLELSALRQARGIKSGSSKH